MVTKVTSVRQFRLNSSLYVSGPIGRAEAPRFLSVCDDVGECVEAANNKNTTTFAFSLHEMSPVHWTDG